MKRGFLNKLVGGAAAAVMCLTGMIPALPASAAQTFYNNKTGTEDGYAYELWKDTGNTSMTITGGGTFSCEWSNINNCLFRKGQKFDCTKTYSQLGEISIDYAVDFQPNGNSYMCVYGWTRNPLVEYYIVESWGSWRPPGNASSLGSVTTDGGTYDIYKTTRYNQPSIDGDTTFDQYWSVRRSKPTGNGTYIEGTISVSNHFRAWEKAGLTMGKMYEVALNIEGYQSSGKATVYGNTLRIGGSGSSSQGSSSQSGNNSQSGSQASGVMWSSDFETDEGYWKARGDAKVAVTSSRAYAGSKSLQVSGRKSSWNGAAIDLNGDYFKGGNAYSFSTAVLQNSGKSATMQMTLQYDQNGQTKYTQVASVNAASGTWTKLENSNFTIPSGASNCTLYIESENLTDYYLDQAMGASAGTKSSVVTGGGNSGSSQSSNNQSNNSQSSNNNSQSSSQTGSGSLFTSTFENGTDYWKSRGNANVSSSSAKAFAGSKSLYVSGRTSSWNGAAIDLDGTYFKAGTAYSFSTQVLQNSGRAATMQLTLQYDQNGQTKYAQVASANAASGTWTKLENTNFTIPAGASNCTLYVESDNLTDYYLDQAMGGTAGSSQSASGSSNSGSQQSSSSSGNGGYYVDPSKPMVAIAFDDGASAYSKSDPAYRIIDAVANSGFHATVFYVGDWIKTNEQVRYAYGKGMEIANHTTTHRNLTQLSASEIRSEFDTTYNKLRNIIGAEPSKLMRLPYLASNWQVQQTLYDVPLISCSIDVQDYNGRSAQQIIQTIQNAANNGTLRNAIVLCHENYASTAEAMEYLMPWLKQNGWQVVTVSEMFAANGKTLQGGQVYSKVS